MSCADLTKSQDINTDVLAQYNSIQATCLILFKIHIENHFFPQNFISHHIHLFTMHLNSFLSKLCCWYIICTLPGQNTVTSVISSYKYQYCKYHKTICTHLSNSNSSRPVLQIPQCIRQTSLNAPLRTEMCPSPLWMVHHGTLPRHHRRNRWLSVQITLSARQRLAHRLKATSHGRKLAQMARHGVTTDGWQGATARMTSRLQCKHQFQ